MRQAIHRDLDLTRHGLLAGALSRHRELQRQRRPYAHRLPGRGGGLPGTAPPLAPRCGCDVALPGGSRALRAADPQDPAAHTAGPGLVQAPGHLGDAVAGEAVLEPRRTRALRVHPLLHHERRGLSRGLLRGRADQGGDGQPRDHRHGPRRVLPGLRLHPAAPRDGRRGRQRRRLGPGARRHGGDLPGTRRRPGRTRRRNPHAGRRRADPRSRRRHRRRRPGKRRRALRGHHRLQPRCEAHLHAGDGPPTCRRASTSGRKTSRSAVPQGR
jgi:hypothetical protein